MKYPITTIASLVLVGCGTTQQSAPAPETPTIEPVAETATPEPTKAKAPDISIYDADEDGNIEAVKQAIADGADANARNEYGFKDFFVIKNVYTQ